MFTKVRSTTSILMVILVVLSGMGMLVAGQQYLILKSAKVMMSAQRTLDESFRIVMKVVGGESNPKMDKQLALQKTVIEGTYSGAVGMNRQLEVRVLADTIAWCVVLVISGLALILNEREEPKPGVPSRDSHK